MLTTYHSPFYILTRFYFITFYYILWLHNTFSLIKVNFIYYNMYTFLFFTFYILNSINLIYFFILFNTFLYINRFLHYFIRLTTYKIIDYYELFIGVTILYVPYYQILYRDFSKIVTDNELLRARLLHGIILMDYILIDV